MIAIQNSSFMQKRISLIVLKLTKPKYYIAPPANVIKHFGCHQGDQIEPFLADLITLESSTLFFLKMEPIIQLF